MRAQRIDWRDPEQMRAYKRDKMRHYRLSESKNFRSENTPAESHVLILGVRISCAAYRRTLEKVLARV